MPAGTDRYPSDPGDPMKVLEERLRQLEAKVEASLARNPLNNGLFRGTLRNVDTGGSTLVTLGPAGLIVEEGAITVGGGPVRALDLAYAEALTNNAALGTTPVEVAQGTFTPPAWATTVIVQNFVLFQLSNVSGALQHMEYRATVQGVPSSGSWTHGVPDAAVGNTVDFHQRTLVRDVDFTTTVAFSGFFGVTAGTSALNYCRAKTTAFYLR